DLPQSATQQVARDDVALDFVGALADPADAHLAVPALEGQVLGHAVAAVNLHGPVDHAAAGLAGDELGHAGLHAIRLAAIGLVRGGQRQPQAGADIDLVVDDHPLHGLAGGERRAERLALLGVVDGELLRLDGHADARRRIGDA